MTQIVPPPAAAAAPRPAAAPERDPAVWEQAVQLEALLFAQLLEVAGVGGLAPAGGRADGPGAQFDSFLRRSHAEAVAGSGATGLAAQLYRELKSAGV